MRYRLLVPIAIVLLAPAIGAHPHMWIDGILGLELGTNGVEGIRVTWMFDQFNSADMLNQLRISPRGQITAAQSREIYETAFVHLRAMDYFVLAKQRNRTVPLPDAVDFTASIDRRRLVYEFTIPLSMSARDANELVLAFFDQSYFISFMTLAASDAYRSGGATFEFVQEPLRLETDGWGNVQITALRTVVR